jgi:small redox-active disulfide protein 2
MDDVKQIQVGAHRIGILGLEEALEEVGESCRDESDETVGKRLLERISRRNYIAPGLTDSFVEALAREYRKFMGDPVPEPAVRGLRIEVLGPGCAGCEQLERTVTAVLSEHRIAADLVHVRDPAEIGRRGVLGLPALTIDGEVKVAGAVPSKARISGWILEAHHSSLS